ncbi:MAG: hypothetical protein K8S27_16425 [Candidatus Omnitrophica bacterium]|nr:hypothetical protein [Candidatus Omnitrophota bacterium]
MTIQPLKNVNSLTALHRTILNDSYTYQWFTRLIAQPEVRSEVSKDPDIHQCYKTLASNFMQQRVLHLIFWGTVLTLLLLKNYLLLLTVVILVLIPFVKLQKKSREYVALISLKIIKGKYTQDNISQTSLYQLSEQLSREFHIPSIVDIIYHTDKILRYAIIFLGTMLLIIWPIYTFTKLCLILFGCFFAIKFLLHSKPIIKILK